MLLLLNSSSQSAVDWHASHALAGQRHSHCVRQQADALMLCGETAAWAYPLKSLEVLRSVATRIEEWVR